MIGTILFNESPILSIGVIFVSGILLKTYIFGSFIFIIILVILMGFYRHESCQDCYDDNIIISPAEGLITNIHQRGENVNISRNILVIWFNLQMLFLSLGLLHIQINL